MPGTKIVIVDDEPDVVLFLQAALEDNNYIALTASSANDGLEIIRNENPGLVCLDILMPKESGISLFRKLRTDPALKGIPVVIHSGLSLTKDLDQNEFLRLEDGTLLSEPEGYIEKPANAEQFLAVIRRVLE